jgi:hypothetical protein
MRTHPLMISELVRQHTAELERSAESARLARAARRGDTPRDRPKVPPRTVRRLRYRARLVLGV